MNPVIEQFLANITSLHQLQAKNLPEDVLEEMVKMEAQELYKICTQFVVLQNNVPTADKMINIEESELIVMVDDYAKELLKRLRG
ncbi:hypothetical protein [Sulfurospirillum arcachonense]|uniref:hypothetical protein n=1 Tax=Sulfurospirillum arcachonense TaxID=57666 RepID=UPI000469DEBF|nr:hypothetical protein [Sulfurospirillum arcachonense]